jgi:Tol biopolymer transport system component
VDSSGNQANGAGSQEAAISADGRYVAFDSYATNLVPGDTNHPGDVFVHDRQTGATELVSVDSSGNQGNGGGSYRPAISADGRYVAFDSYAADLVPGDTNGSNDVFVHDRQTGTTERVNVDSAGNQGDGGDSQGAAISADGRFVAFQSGATNLVPGDTNGNFDVFVHDRQTGATELVSVDSAGNQGGGHSYGAAISADGRYVAFESEASNLVPGDTNGSNDVFVHDRQTGVTELVSVGISGSLGDGASNNAAISTDGRYVAFESGATNLVPGDTNGNFDVFVRDRDATAATPTPTPPPVQTDLTQDAPAGATVLQPTDPSGFAARDEIVINPGGPDQEYSVVNSLGSLDLAAPLQFSHSAGEQIVRVATGIAPGDANCNRMITAQDAISVLRRVEGLAPYDHCVAAGNVVCTDGFTALDALDILLYVSNSSVSLPQGCPAFPVKLPETG